MEPLGIQNCNGTLLKLFLMTICMLHAGPATNNQAQPPCTKLNSFTPQILLNSSLKLIYSKVITNRTHTPVDTCWTIYT
jgi:hypothetical protein